MRRRKRLLFLILPITYYTFFAGNAYTARYLALRLAFHLLSVLLLGIWLVDLVRRGKGIPRTPLDRSLLLWLGVTLAASLTGLSPRFSLERMWLASIYVLGLYLFVDLQHRGWLPTPIQALFLTAAVVCLVGLHEWVSWYLGSSFLPGATWSWPTIGGWRNPLPPTVYRLDGTLAGATPLAAYLALVIAPAIGWLLTAERRQTKGSLGVGLGAALVIQALTFSRGGILALGISLPLTAAGWIVVRSDSPQRLKQQFLRRHPWRVWILRGASLVIVVFAGGFWLSHSFTGRLGSTLHRLTLWHVALDTFRGHPGLGVGPANFGRALLLQNRSSLPLRQIQTAHNAYLNIAAEGGLLGLLTGAWVVLSGVRAWKDNWRAGTEVHRLRMIACGAGLLGLGAQLLVDTIVAPANWLPVLIIAAFILAPERAGQGLRTPRNQPWSSVAALLALVLFTTWLGWKDLAQYHFDRSVQATRKEDFETAKREIDRARALDGDLSLYAFQSAHIQGLWASASEDAAMAKRAISDYEAGLSVDPVWGRQTANMASLLWMQGDRVEAIRWMERTVSAVSQPIYLLNLGRFYELEGMESEAWDRYAEALQSAPTWAGSDFWTETIERAEAWPEILRRAQELVVETDGVGALTSLRAQVAWARGDWLEMEQVARSRMRVDPDASEGYMWMARALLQQAEVQEALAAAEQAVRLTPDDSESLAIRGCARGLAGDRLDAIGDLQKALFISPDLRLAYACLGEMYEQGGDLEAAIEAYLRAVGPRTISQDVEMTLYDRLVSFDTLPGLVRIRMGEQEADPWLRAARLFEETNRCEQAQAVYRALLAEDEYLAVARARMRGLPCHIDEGI